MRKIIQSFLWYSLKNHISSFWQNPLRYGIIEIFLCNLQIRHLALETWYIYLIGRKSLLLSSCIISILDSLAEFYEPIEQQLRRMWKAADWQPQDKTPYLFSYWEDPLQNTNASHKYSHFLGTVSEVYPHSSSTNCLIINPPILLFPNSSTFEQKN